jgi:hypothetical protein
MVMPVLRRKTSWLRYPLKNSRELTAIQPTADRLGGNTVEAVWGCAVVGEVRIGARQGVVQANRQPDD